MLENWLLDYSWRADAWFLLEGCRFGFRIPALGELKVFLLNLKSVNGMENIVQDKMGKEVLGGRILGLYNYSPLENLCVLPWMWQE